MHGSCSLSLDRPVLQLKQVRPSLLSFCIRQTTSATCIATGSRADGRTGGGRWRGRRSVSWAAQACLASSLWHRPCRRQRDATPPHLLRQRQQQQLVDRHNSGSETGSDRQPIARRIAVTLSPVQSSSALFPSLVAG